MWTSIFLSLRGIPGTPLRGKDKVAAKREKAVEAAGDELAIAESASNVVWASGLDEALGALTTGDGPGSGGGAAVDRHPERRPQAVCDYFSSHMPCFHDLEYVKKLLHLKTGVPGF